METLLEFKDIKYSVGAGKHICISGLLQQGGILNISGPSGSGKTTLLRILSRLRPAEGGTVYLGGTDWSEFPSVTWRRKVSYVSQKPAIFDGSVKANLLKPFELNAVKQDVDLKWDTVMKLMEKMYLSGGILEQDARTLSGGEAARMSLIRTILLEPKVLLLDEPLAALDSRAAAGVIGVIDEWRNAAKERGVVLVSHVGEFSGLSGWVDLRLDQEEGGAVE